VIAMNGALIVYVVYVALAVLLVTWLGVVLQRYGRIFLDDVFVDQAGLAGAVSRLLVTGFLVFTLGYAFLLLRVEDQMSNVEALQFLIRRLGILLVSLGLIHLVNTLIFLRFRRARSEDEDRSTARAQQRRRSAIDGPPSEQARLRE
jgi:hypothetical protein